jgi:hypothetical protein
MRNRNHSDQFLTTLLKGLAVWATMGPSKMHLKPVVRFQIAQARCESFPSQLLFWASAAGGCQLANFRSTEFYESFFS